MEGIRHGMISFLNILYATERNIVDILQSSSCNNNGGVCMVLWSVRERRMAQYRSLQLPMFSVGVTPPLASG